MQVIGQTSHDTVYITLSDHTVQVEKVDKNRKTIKSTLKAQVVVSISNWRFNRDLVESKTIRPCNPSDVTVAIKLSSTEFINEKNKNDLYHFDKNGALFSYTAFLSLMKDFSFTSNFMKLVKAKFEETEGPLTLSEVDDIDTEIRDIVSEIAALPEEIENLEEDDEEEISLSRKKRAGHEGADRRGAKRGKRVQLDDE